MTRIVSTLVALLLAGLIAVMAWAVSMLGYIGWQCGLVAFPLVCAVLAGAMVGFVLMVLWVLPDLWRAS